MEAHHFDEALAILKETQALGPSPAWRERIVLLTARAYFYAKRFDKAGETFEQVANSSSRLRREALFNAALAWLQQNDHSRFLADTKDLAGNPAGDETRGDLLL
jgi:tetratricopeptide (TPR) repeat protein